MLNSLLSTEIIFLAWSTDKNGTGCMPIDWKICPNGPLLLRALMNMSGDENSGTPAMAPRSIVTIIRNFAASAGSIQGRACGALEQMNASSVCGLAVLTLMVPWPQTVTVRFSGLSGSGSTNVA